MFTPPIAYHGNNKSRMENKIDAVPFESSWNGMKLLETQQTLTTREEKEKLLETALDRLKHLHRDGLMVFSFDELFLRPPLTNHNWYKYNRLIKQIQTLSYDLTKIKYGSNNGSPQNIIYRVNITLEFPDGDNDNDHNSSASVLTNVLPPINDKENPPKTTSIMIETAPLHLVPYSIYTFLELARTFAPDNDKSLTCLRPDAAFYRSTFFLMEAFIKPPSSSLPNHSTTACRTKIPQMVFREYSPHYPHVEQSVGFLTHSFDDQWPFLYISLMDNQNNLGPHSGPTAHETLFTKSNNKAFLYNDGATRNGAAAETLNYNYRPLAQNCFGKVLNQDYTHVVQGRMRHSLPLYNTFDRIPQVKVVNMTILVQHQRHEWIEWRPHS